jgi:O-antigen ligase
LASSVIVFSRPAGTAALLTFVLVSTLVLRLIVTVDARKIIASIIDGCGLYLVANLFCYAMGLQSPASEYRIGGLVESTGFVRIIFPLTQSINIPPIIAAVYVAGFFFLIRESGWLRRSLRSACLIVAIIVLAGAGTRAPMVSAILVSLIAIFVPFAIRWMGQIVTVLAAISAVILPNIIKSVEFLLQPLMSLASERETQSTSISSIQGRDHIWDRSIAYWGDWVNDLPHILLGYGVNGQYRSGASFAYSDSLSAIIRNPELAFTHNSFLQQLFDGGVLGWLLLAVAIYWASARLASRRRDWGHWAVGGTVALTVLLVSAMTEVSVAPGPTLESFWVLTVLVGVACQKSQEQKK